uniref:6-pyruvoyl-tetrahydropterin synthase n=1 Tax=uncultured marine thaumarchaeote KM3_99_A02 TaxID=1456353 RepID=A0A075HY16_9ARCH|nr:6-pyruvoyl-tetrahydropterin synthase [uncultured marine thaumarchaeote KM3_99_A02]
MQTKIGVEFEIDFAHTLKGHPKCGKPHGHTAKIIVEASGELKKGSTYEENMVIEFDEMKKYAGRQSNDLITRTLMICLISLHQKI